MRGKNQYRPLEKNHYYIDKTESLEKGIEVFPSIYIEGAAASGKTTAVRMLIERHPEVEAHVFWMQQEMEDRSEFANKLHDLELQKADDRIWAVFEELDNKIPTEMIAEMVQFLQGMPVNHRGILISREQPAEPLLELFWKREMEMISQEALLFSLQDVAELTEHVGSMVNPRRLYEETGGWAGCVDLMLRMSEGKHTSDVEELRDSYGIAVYIENQILGTLSTEEQELMRVAAVCPWINELLCQEVWNIPYAAEILEKLRRKGMLTFERRRHRWKIAPLFAKNYQVERDYKRQGFWLRLGEWYEQQGCVKEFIWCLRMSEDEGAYHSGIVKYYAQIPFEDISYKEVIEWKDNTPQVCYLRGMYCCFHQNQEGLWREIRKLGKLEVKDKLCKEIYLNLMYVNSEVSLDEWLAILEDLTKDGERFQLYEILGGSVSCLCGLRDIAGLFACTRREENHKGRIWKEGLGECEWEAYQLARLDYYLETERIGMFKEEDKQLLDQITRGPAPWRYQLAGMYLLNKIQTMKPEVELYDRIEYLEQSLFTEEAEICIRNAVAVSSLYSVWRKESEKLSRWLLYMSQERNTEIREDNYYQLCCQAKGYLLLEQYDRSEKIFRQIIPYLQKTRRYRYLAEVLFQQALINWGNDRHSQALQNAIESFIVTGNSRYVGFYASYGKRGKEVLEAYIYWMRANSPEGWHRKKKYNYGNVLRMPVEDYLEVIRRCMNREERSSRQYAEEMKEEKLTMMETIILQDIGKGLTNADICVELNLKLPTVKSHIYSLYKKLGVNSRVQAVIKGKEKGILD